MSKESAPAWAREAEKACKTAIALYEAGAIEGPTDLARIIAEAAEPEMTDLKWKSKVLRKTKYDQWEQMDSQIRRLQATQAEVVKVLGDIVDSDMAMREEDEGRKSTILRRARTLLTKPKADT